MKVHRRKVLDEISAWNCNELVTQYCSGHPTISGSQFQGICACNLRRGGVSCGRADGSESNKEFHDCNCLNFRNYGRRRKICTFFFLCIFVLIDVFSLTYEEHVLNGCFSLERWLGLDQRLFRYLLGVVVIIHPM